MSMIVLGIESSCDETAAAVVCDGRDIRSSVVHSQAALHAQYGGVVPEIAGRSHLAQISPVIQAALSQAQLSLEHLHGVAVTTRPGLIGSLLIGVHAAKSLAWSLGIPLVGVHHIEAHVYAATMEQQRDLYPCLALVVSGGHSALYHARSPLSIEYLGGTLDDAAGEAFDKVAHILGLGYPGGPLISKLAEQGNPRALRLPSYKSREENPAFSFSGLKTAVLYHVRGQNAARELPPPEAIADRADIAASFEQALVDALVEETLRTARRLDLRRVLVAGGVACNRRLRQELHSRAALVGVEAFFPSPAYCTDNAAMIAGLGYHQLRAGLHAGLDLDAAPR
jgi:N6-L-threonylcarbamoyladenine synthase